MGNPEPRVERRFDTEFRMGYGNSRRPSTTRRIVLERIDLVILNHWPILARGRYQGRTTAERGLKEEKKAWPRESQPGSADMR